MNPFATSFFLFGSNVQKRKGVDVFFYAFVIRAGVWKGNKIWTEGFPSNSEGKLMGSYASVSTDLRKVDHFLFAAKMQSVVEQFSFAFDAAN